MDDLSAIGFDIVGYGCTTCIGNSGPLPERVARRAGWPGPARGHPVGQPELPRPRASGSGAGVPGVAATCDRLCAGRRRRARPGRRAAGRRRRRRAGPAARHLAQGRGNPGLSGRRPGRRRFRARLPGGAGQPRLACAGGALGHALSMAAGLHHPAPSALRGAGRRQPARPLHGPSAAGAGRRRHHRPHLASQRHSARQPGGRFPGGARRRPTRPECSRRVAATGK